MARITVEDCLEQIPNRFQLVLAATYRARMLSQGHTPRVESKNNPLVTALRACSRALIRFLASAVLRLKRIDSLPVSTMWQWWVRRSSSAVVIFASPNTLDHSAKSRLVVIITLVCSYSRLSKWNNNAPPAWLNGR